MMGTSDACNSVLACGVCDRHFRAYEGMREPVACGAPHLCRTHQDEFDSIDWDAIREREVGMA